MSVAVIMGSDSDLPSMQGAIDVLARFGVPHVVHCVSAHRDPHGMLEFASRAADDGDTAGDDPVVESFELAGLALDTGAQGVAGRQAALEGDLERERHTGRPHEPICAWGA